MHSEKAVRLFAEQLKARHLMSYNHLNSMQILRMQHADELKYLTDAHQEEMNELLASQLEERKANHIVDKSHQKQSNSHNDVRGIDLRRQLERAALIPLPPLIKPNSLAAKRTIQRIPLRTAPRQESTSHQFNLNIKGNSLLKQEQYGIDRVRMWKRKAKSNSNTTKHESNKHNVVSSRQTQIQVQDNKENIESTSIEEYEIDELPPKTPRYSPTKF
jgi:hypothetical protein